MTAPRAVLLDALGTLLELEDPVGALREELAGRGTPVGADEAAQALGAEMAHYRAHCGEASDPERLTELRMRCAEVLRAGLPSPARELPEAELLAALLGAMRFRPYDDVVPALSALRAGGARLVIVSNWDISLHEVLAATGLDALVDAALTSAEVGAAKPDAAIFSRALDLAGGVAPSEALHVGDDAVADVHGALEAGIPAVLLDRHGGTEPPPGARLVRSLAELAPGGR